MFKKLGKISYIVSSAFLICAMILSFIPAKQVSAEVKVHICHYDGGNKEYSTRFISANSVLSGHGGHTNDIWPEFTLDNGTVVPAQGDQSILANDCVVPSAASVSYDIGTCAYTPASGSLTPVTITIVGATVHTGSVAGDITTTQTLYLAPGSYSWNWEAIAPAYTGSGTISFIVGDCTPPPLPFGSAAGVAGTCSWSQATGSLTPVTLTISHAVVHTDGIAGDITASQTVNVPAGSYSWPWEASSGYQGSGTISINAGDCTPPDASASISVGQCSWNEASGSLTAVTVTINGAIVHTGIASIGDLTSTQIINLGPGTYHFTWTADSTHKGSGSLDFTVGDCTPGRGSASVSQASCSWSPAGGSLTPVTITISHASVDTGAIAGVITTTGTYNLGPGSYNFPWVAASGYLGSGTLSFTVGSCVPPDASASANVGSCSWNVSDGSKTPVSINVDGAIVHTGIPAYGDLTANQTLSLGPGDYSFSWIADATHKGSGTLDFTVNDCTPPDADPSAVVGSCSWSLATGSKTDVEITVNGAIVETGLIAGDLTGNTTLHLGPGSYNFPWVADDFHKGSGTLSFTVGDCTPPDASAAAEVGSCSWTEAGGSSTAVDITVTGAIVHTGILGIGDLTSSQTIHLGPGSYDFDWEADATHKGSGTLSITVGDCTPGNGLATSSIGTCTWNVTDGSKTPVDITIDHAAVDTSPVNGVITASQTLSLAPGSYHFPWEASAGYLGSGTLNLEIPDCTPPDATASATPGTCAWNVETGSITPVEITVDGAIVHTGLPEYGDISLSQSINLPAGSYNFPWESDLLHKGSGTLTFETGQCIPLGKLGLIPICAGDAANFNGWRVINTNPVQMPFEYSGAGGVSGTGTVDANSTAEFATARNGSSDDLTLYSGGDLQAYSKAKTGCINNPPNPPNPPTNPQIPVTGNTPAILIPVTGLDTAMVRRILPGALMSFGFGFLGIGLVFSGIARKKKE